MRNKIIKTIMCSSLIIATPLAYADKKNSCMIELKAIMFTKIVEDVDYCGFKDGLSEKISSLYKDQGCEQLISNDENNKILSYTTMDTAIAFDKKGKKKFCQEAKTGYINAGKSLK